MDIKFFRHEVGVTNYDHLHIYDRNQTPLDVDLEPVAPRDPAAHIEIWGAE